MCNRSSRSGQTSLRRKHSPLLRDPESVGQTSPGDRALGRWRTGRDGGTGGCQEEAEGDDDKYHRDDAAQGLERRWYLYGRAHDAGWCVRLDWELTVLL